MRYSFTTKVTRSTTVKRWLAEQGVSHRLFKKMLVDHLIWVDGKYLTMVRLKLARLSALKFRLAKR